MWSEHGLNLELSWYMGSTYHEAPPSFRRSKTFGKKKAVQALALNKLGGRLLSGSKQGSGGARAPASLLHEFDCAVSTPQGSGAGPAPASPPWFSPFSLTAGGASDGVQLHRVVTWQIEEFSCYLINAKETHEALKL